MPKTRISKLEKIVKELYAGFEIKEFKHEGQSETEKRVIVKRGKERRDDTPSWKLISTFYNLRLDQDSIYEFSLDFLGDLLNNDLQDKTIDQLREMVYEYADSDTDVYTTDLTEWLNKSNYNVYYLSEALEEFQPKDGFKALAIAQMQAREEVYNKVLDFIEAQLKEE